jgi:hypothetical protein
MIIKYTLRHVLKFMEQGNIDALISAEYYPDALLTRVPGCSVYSE